MAPPKQVPRAAALPMLDVYLPMMRTAGVLAAAELGVFAALARAPRTAGALARTLRADAHGIARLLDLLAEAGWVARRGARFALTAPTRRWFTRAGRVDYTAGLVWTAHAWRLTAELGAAIRRGGPALPLFERFAREPALGADFAAYMRAFAEHVGPAIVRAVRPARTARRLLDIGGSHGLHAIGFCRAVPGLEAIVLDHASALGATAANARAAGLQRRIRTRAGDCVTDELGTGFDLVLYFSVAHNQTAAANARVLRKCARALRSGGTLVIHDYLRDEVPAAFGAAFDLTLLLEVGQRTWDRAQFERWLRAAGFVRTRHVPLADPAMGSLIVATTGAS